MARQSATVRKRRPRAKRASNDARAPKVAAAEPIESAPEVVAPIAEQNIAAAEPIMAVEEPVVPVAEPIVVVEEPVMPADKPLTLVQVPSLPEAEPVAVANERILSADEPAMPVPVPIRTPAECKARLDRITRQWCDLAERRLQHYTELYRSGRWRRYYTEERFVVVMNEVAKTVANWRALADRMTPAAAGNDDLRLSA